jgi:hypothetical protein
MGSPVTAAIAALGKIPDDPTATIATFGAA